mmetsp:Transcript_11418/g.21115  ORF Transcript_11418/g.21115 Transcript_11418/m.21115 type:complete len:99 (-) Transcript_11418:237-533(-)
MQIEQHNMNSLMPTPLLFFWRNLCHAMCPELQVYKEILQHAKNLNSSQVEESITEVNAFCPEEGVAVRSCPGIPRFPLMRVPRRQFRTEVKKRLFAVA